MTPNPCATNYAQLVDKQSLIIRLPELGDGSMLFAIWQRWRADRPANHSRLHLVVCDSQPIPRDVFSTRPEHTELRTLLLAQYPPAINGIHRLIFKVERLTIDFRFGDIGCTDPAADIQPRVPSNFAIIGAGIAGLSMAHALAMRGHAVTLIEQEHPLAGGSGNPRALLLSKLPKLARVQHNLQTSGGLSTARWWQAWTDNVITTTGALLLPDEQDLDNATDYPVELVEQLDPAEIANRAGIISHAAQLYLPQAATLDPAALRDHVLASPLIYMITAPVERLSATDDAQWQLIDATNQVITTASHIIVACAKDSPRLCPALPSLTVIRGQMAWCVAHTDAPKIALGYGGYAVKYKQTLLLGSSFIRDDETTDIRPAEHQVIYDLLQSAYPDYAHTLPAINSWEGRASLRALPRDSMPLVGAVPEMAGVYSLTGLGSKGFSFAPLCAEWLASYLLGEPLPLPDLLARQISPSRFIKKERVRKPYYTPPS